MSHSKTLGRKAPPRTWSADALKEALTRGSHEEKLTVLREIGVLAEDGTLGVRYKPCRTAVSRADNSVYLDR